MVTLMMIVMMTMMTRIIVTITEEDTRAAHHQHLGRLSRMRAWLHKMIQASELFTAALTFQCRGTGMYSGGFAAYAMISVYACQ